ncbi:unnamed protein product [marine sediment metagenome]|uniref:Uncharacterized protein n=1 Tax=marine sediment metagenome TaxID=412755 RepID=X0YGV8_9ZZZZ
MNGETKKAIKGQLINWVGIAVIFVITFYFTTITTLKGHTEDIRFKVDEKVFLEYVKQKDIQHNTSIELIKAIQINNNEQSEKLWNELDNIKTDIRTLYVNMGYKTRGIKLNSLE